MNRGEIWLVQFDPSVGDEIKKLRAAVIIGIQGVFLSSLTDCRSRYKLAAQVSTGFLAHSIASRCNNKPAK